MRFWEWQGLLHGYVLGCLTALISFFRSSRMFHPKGMLYRIQINSDSLPPYGMIRLSSAWWKNKEWIDVLGISIRVSTSPIQSVKAQKEDQDLLFATVFSPWLLFISPILTKYQDFLSNVYFAVGFFERNGRMVKYKIVPDGSCETHGTRAERLMRATDLGRAWFTLLEQEVSSSEWMVLARFQLGEALNFDQEALRFTPFQSGLEIHPRGYLQYLRLGAYRMGQWARPRHSQAS